MENQIKKIDSILSNTEKILLKLGGSFYSKGFQPTAEIIDLIGGVYLESRELLPLDMGYVSYAETIGRGKSTIIRNVTVFIKQLHMVNHPLYSKYILENNVDITNKIFIYNFIKNKDYLEKELLGI